MILPLYNSLAPLTINRLAAAAGPALDPDAQAYIDAVELEDGQALEDGVRTAINDFVVGCKSDGIWSAIKSACILAGARTLDGALVPLVGTAPTNNNFVSGDYDRKTGLKGDGTSKKLATGYFANYGTGTPNGSDLHASTYLTEATTVFDREGFIGAGSTSFELILVNNFFYPRIGATASAISVTKGFGFIGASSTASSIDWIYTSQSGTVAATPGTLGSVEIFIFSRSSTSIDYSNSRQSFYSFGDGLTLADLNSRVSTLMTDIAAAIP